MAEGDKFIGLPGDRNRDGLDDDFDRKPGNSSDSPEYDRRYNPRNEEEFSNLLEPIDQTRQRRLVNQLELEREQAINAAHAAQTSVHFWPTMGKFIIPKENTWAAHAELMRDDSVNLYFNPEKYPFFDKIIAEKFNNPALFDKTHPDFAKYENLRTNLEVIRNDIIGSYLNDGSYDPGDEKYIPNIQAIASCLGEALANDSWIRRPFFPYFNRDVANVEGVGAAEMYKYLLLMQEPPGKVGSVIANVKSLLGFPKHNWDLPPLEETPFSAQGLAAPPPHIEYHLNDAELLAACASLDMQTRLANSSRSALVGARNLGDVANLQPPTKEQSVDEARKILRFLRNLQFGDQDMSTWLSQGGIDEQVAKGEALAKLVAIFGAQLKEATLRNPNAIDYIVDDAGAAANALSLGLSEHTLGLLPEGHPQRAPLAALIVTMPEGFDSRIDQSPQRLLENIELGIERLSGKTLTEETPADRLVTMSERVSKAANNLRAANLQPPAREESIELAREIIRRLKGLSFANQPLSEVIDTGRPEDKAAFAQKIDEVVDMYQNIVSEAAQTNRAIVNDPLVRGGNEAAGTFAHSIKLMAAKEIPNSVATAQQISAEITQDPAEWKALHDRTVGRLVKSMEGGLEKAISEIEVQQQQEQQQDEQMAQSIIDSQLAQSNSSGKRRRRRRSSGSGSSLASPKAAAKRRSSNDKNGDGVADKFQAIGIQLKGSDLSAARELGGLLRTMNNEAATLAPIAPMTTPSMEQTAMVDDGKIKPDDKPFAARERDGNKPSGSRNQNRPRI